MKLLKLLTLIMTMSLGVVHYSMGQCSASFYNNVQGNALSAGATFIPGSGIYSWTFGDGTSFTSTSPYVNHSYTSVGSYSVCLSFLDTITNCTASFCDSIQINQTTPCNIQANFIDSVVSGNTHQFYGYATGGLAGGYSYVWYFSDATFTSSTLQNPTHTFTGNPPYYVDFIVTDANGCADTVSQSIGGAPCNFSANLGSWVDTAANNNGLVDFYTYATTGGSAPYSYSWDFGDGNTSTQASPSHQYANPNQWYWACVTMTDANGCTAVSCDTVSAYNPCADSSLYISFNENVNPNNLATFTANYGINPISTYWTFGDGSQSSSLNPSHFYNSPGTYTVTVYAYFANGCSRSFTKVITVGNASCNTVANFNYTINGNSVLFQSTGSIGYYHWSFGDGNFASNTNLTHTYTSAGTYTVSLAVTDSTNWMCADTIYQTITVGNTPCNLNAWAVDSLVSGNTVDFYGYATGGVAPYTYWWDFGDVNFMGNIQNPQHTYATAGTYTYSVAVVDAIGCADTIYQTITVGNAPCNLSAWAVDSALQNNTVAFYGGVNNANSGYSYWWNFGDGNYGYNAYINHTYANAGTYNYTLIVQDTISGCVDTISQSVVVSGSNPCAGFAANYNYSINGNTVVFQSTGSNGQMYTWDFGNGTYGASSGSYTYQYPSNGVYYVCMTVTDSLITGCQDTYCDTIVIGNNNPCNINAYAWDSVATGNTVQFGGSAWGGAAPYNYYWYFGDGGTSQQQYPVHTFNNAGTYTYTFVAMDSLGCADTVYQVVTVGGANPCAGFTGSFTYNADTAGYVAFNANFAGSNPQPMNVSWNFGNGMTSNSWNPYVNLGQGVHYVCMTADSGLCTTTYCDTVVVNNAPCTQNEVTLALDLDNYPQETTWDLTDANGNILYSGGNYTTQGGGVTMTFCLPAGCYDFNIYDSYGDGICCLYGQGFYTLTDGATGATLASGGAFNYQESTTFCVGGATNPCSNYLAYFVPSANNNVVFFNGIATGGNGGDTYSWNFGDGTTGFGVSPTHTYQAIPVNGYYNVCLSVTDSFGCTATYCDTVAVSAAPCAQNAVTLTLNLDNFPQETTWDLKDASGNVVYSGANYNQNGGTVIQNFCLPTGCYDFTIYDSYGDGICCVWGSGDYSLTDANGNSLAQGGAFTYQESTNICVGGATNSCGNFMARYAYSVNPNGTVQFNSNVTGGTAPYTYQWQFNNGASTQANPAHNYGGNGYFFATLIATDANNCIYTFFDTVMVTTANSNPCANATMTVDMQQDSLNPFVIWMQPVVNNAPLNSQYTFAWSFGDGTGVNTGSPIHQYTNYGSYIVTVVAVDSINGCAMTFMDTITIDTAGNFSRNLDYKDVKPSIVVNTLPPVINFTTSTTKLQNVNSATLFPSPATSVVNVKLESTIDEDLEVTVLNMQGKLIYNRVNSIHTGENLITLPVSELASGTYLVRLLGNTTQQTLKFVKE